MSRRGDVALLLIVAATWGASYLFIRVAAPALGPLPLMAGRVIVASVALAAWALARREPLRLREDAGHLLVLGLVHAAAPYALIAAAEVHLTASSVAVLMAAQPMATGLLGRFVPGERPAPRAMLGLALGLVGVAVLLGWRPEPMDVRSAVLTGAVLLAAVLYAVGSLYVKRFLPHTPAITLALGQQLGALAWLAVPAAFALPAARPQPAAMGAMFALGLLCTAFAYVLFFRLIARAGAVRASTVSYAIPVFGVAWGTLLLGERPGPGVYAGLAIILSSLVLSHSGRRHGRRAEAPAARADA